MNLPFLKYATLFFFTLLSFFGNAQYILVDSVGGVPNISAALEVKSLNRGFLAPRLTTAQMNAIGSPAAGLLIYNTTNLAYYYYNGSAWGAVSPGDNLGNHTASSNLQLNGNYLSNDGGSEGLSVANNGQLTASPATTGAGNIAILSAGDIRTQGQGTGLYLTNGAIGITGNNGNSGDLRLLAGGSSRLRILGGGQIGIGNTAPGADLDVTGNVHVDSLNINNAFGFPTADGANGEVLTTDGSGSLNWAAPGDNLGNHSVTQDLLPSTNGAYDLGSPTANYANIHFSGEVHYGSNVLIQTPTNSGTFFGVLAGPSSTGLGNTAFGFRSGQALGTGNQNTAIGYNALNNTIGSHHNVAIGSYALYSNTGGFQNVAIGVNALYSNIGNASNGNDNIGIGYNTLYTNTTGDNNTAVGREALYRTNSDNNVALGREAAYTVSTGGNNTYLGYQAGRGTVTHAQSGSVFIGHQAGYNETSSNKLYIDNSNTATPLVYGDFVSDSVRVNGDLGVSNDAHVHGELHSDNTGSYNLLPIAIGHVLADGTIQNGTGNFTVNRTATGIYRITINGLTFDRNNHIVIGSAVDFQGIVQFSSFGGDILLNTRNNGTNALQDGRFTFMVYAP